MPLVDPTVSGPRNPVPPAPPRRPGSLRRTTTIDTNRPEGFGAPAELLARARDLLTAPDGTLSVVAEAEITAQLAPAHELLAIGTDPDEPALAALVGATVGPGFRARVDATLPALRGTGALLYLLLDDMPGATLVAGYSMLHADYLGDIVHDEYLDARGDLCAGWARDGAMWGLIMEHGRNPTPIGSEAPDLRRADDPDAWHPLTPLRPLGMRRVRRLDVALPEAPDAPYPVDVFFRDSHVDADGRETIVHEYSVTVAVGDAAGRAGRTVVAIDATADVLPWQECPAATASAQRLVGRPLAELRPWVRETFVGTSTCTHLNDVLRGLADVDHLVDRLEALTGARR